MANQAALAEFFAAIDNALADNPTLQRLEELYGFRLMRFTTEDPDLHFVNVFRLDLDAEDATPVVVLAVKEFVDG